MTKKRFASSLVIAALAVTLYPAAAAAQQDQPQQTQQAEPATAASAVQAATANPKADKPDLWIAKYEADTKAASAVASIQASTANALKYSNLFDSVKTFETDSAQPEGTWTLTGKETEFSGGSAAKRALVGFGSGRSKVTMEYTLYDAAKKAVWTKKITTKANFWGAAALGAAQDQGKAMDEQGQKLTDALAQFFSSDKRAKK
ncbi:MAG TPA: DUF4410 domain-containing protein [Terracidiphilus sp.]|nr:DUF4410 domain-containing protein [Terracidiphilus sp.]